MSYLEHNFSHLESFLEQDGLNLSNSEPPSKQLKLKNSATLNLEGKLAVTSAKYYE